MSKLNIGSAIFKLIIANAFAYICLFDSLDRRVTPAALSASAHLKATLATQKVAHPSTDTCEIC